MAGLIFCYEVFKMILWDPWGTGWCLTCHLCVPQKSETVSCRYSIGAHNHFELYWIHFSRVSLSSSYRTWWCFKGHWCQRPWQMSESFVLAHLTHFLAESGQNVKYLQTPPLILLSPGSSFAQVFLPRPAVPWQHSTLVRGLIVRVQTLQNCLPSCSPYMENQYKKGILFSLP